MAKVVAENLNPELKSFVVSDSTFPGAGKYGIGHLFAETNATYE